MSDLIAILRAIVRDELRSLRLGDIAVVTEAPAHSSDGDDNNHECSVKLRESGIELCKVPIATPHIGQVSAPRRDDLVLVSYVGGDPNRPIVVGRLYSDQSRPPVHEADEWRVEAVLSKETSMAMDKQGAVILKAGGTKLTLEKDGHVKVDGKQDLKIEVKGNVSVSCVDCKLDASGNIDLGNGGSGIITVDSHKCYFTGESLVGSRTVKAKG